MRRLLLVALLATVPTLAAAQDHWPAAAEKRFGEAVELARAGKHLEAAQVYRGVADWPGDDFRERPQALFAAAHELEIARELERAVATYRELVRRFPKSDFVPVATRAADALDGAPGGLEFQRRYSEALDVLLPAVARQDRNEIDAATPGLERAYALLDRLLVDHADHPQAVDVAIAESDVLARLRRFAEAQAAAEDAIAFAEREAHRPGADPTKAQAQITNAREQLAAVVSARRIENVAGLWSRLVLAALALGVLATRPWRRFRRATARLLGGLLIADGVLAAIGAAGAEYVRRTSDADSLLGPGLAALLVALPGAVAVAVALGVVTAFPRRQGPVIAALAGTLGSLATFLVLVRAFGLFRLLPRL